MTLRLDTEIIYTYSLRELITRLENGVSFYMSQKEEYSERLGTFLREAEEKYNGEDWFKQLSLGEKLPKGKAKGKKKKKEGKKKKKKGKKKGEPDDWIPFQSMLLSSSVQCEAELMFEAIEATSVKIEELEEAKASIEELSNVGLGDEVVYVVFLREGVPRKIVIKPAGAEQVEKFEFSRGFTAIQVLQP